MASDRPLSKDLKPGMRLRWRGSSIVTLARRKDPDEPGRSIPFHSGWWLADSRGGLADFVIDAENGEWEILDQ